MKRLIITLVLLLGWMAASAQWATDPAASEELREMFDQLERGERVELSEQTKSTSGEKQRYYTMVELYEKYASREGFTSVVFGKKMMAMMADRMQREDEALAELLEGIQVIRVISTQRPDSEFERDAMTWQKTMRGIEQISHTIADGQVTYTYLKDGDRWDESVFALFSFGAEEQVVVYIKGYFSVKDISRLSAIRPK